MMKPTQFKNITKLLLIIHESYPQNEKHILFTSIFYLEIR